MATLLGTIVGLERQWRQRMAGTRTNALVAAGASAFVMCAFLTRDNSRGEAQIVSYVVSGVGFLGAGVIFKDAGGVRGLNTAATIWCSAAIGAICGLGSIAYAATVAGVVLLANVGLRPLAYKLHPIQQAGGEQEVVYAFELVCRAEDEAHIRATVARNGADFTHVELVTERRHGRDAKIESVGSNPGSGPAGRVARGRRYRSQLGRERANHRVNGYYFTGFGIGGRGIMSLRMAVL